MTHPRALPPAHPALQVLLAQLPPPLAPLAPAALFPPAAPLPATRAKKVAGAAEVLPQSAHRGPITPCVAAHPRLTACSATLGLTIPPRGPLALPLVSCALRGATVGRAPPPAPAAPQVLPLQWPAPAATTRACPVKLGALAPSLASPAAAPTAPRAPLALSRAARVCLMPASSVQLALSPLPRAALSAQSAALASLQTSLGPQGAPPAPRGATSMLPGAALWATAVPAPWALLAQRPDRPPLGA